MVHPDFIKHLMFWGKIAGSASTIGGILWGIVNWFRKISETNVNVSSLVNNHLPHITDVLGAHGAALEGIKSDVRAVSVEVDGVSKRLEDTRSGVSTLGASFVQHLENVSEKKKAKKKSRKS